MPGRGNSVGTDSGAVDPRITAFIGRHRVMTLAVASVSSTPGDLSPELWCCNLFYAWMPERRAFVFTSPEATRHAAMFMENPTVAASVVLESKVVGRLQGLQIQGMVCRADAAAPELLAAARKAYLRRFPFAAPMLSDLWVLQVTRLKYTDNTLGFGTKILWP